MRMRKYIINLFAAAALLVGCGESLEDTYSDYAGDGKIRYVAKCTEVHATPGWERLLLEWINGTDATVDKIKVIWSCRAWEIRYFFRVQGRVLRVEKFEKRDVPVRYLCCGR